MFLVDQEFKQLRLIKDGSHISFLVEGIRNSADILFVKKIKTISQQFFREMSKVIFDLYQTVFSESVKPVIELAFSKIL